MSGTRAERAITRPSDDAIQAAYHRAELAFAVVFAGLGPGSHQLHYAAQDTDGFTVVREATVEVGRDGDGWRFEADPDTFELLKVALLFGIEGSCVALGVLIARTYRERQHIACGWKVSKGWLHPMLIADVAAALTPCPGVDVPAFRAYAVRLPDPASLDL